MKTAKKTALFNVILSFLMIASIVLSVVGCEKTPNDTTSATSNTESSDVSKEISNDVSDNVSNDVSDEPSVNIPDDEYTGQIESINSILLKEKDDYKTAKALIAEKKYEEAYKLLENCRVYTPAMELSACFTTEFDKSTMLTYDKDGNLVSKSEYICDEKGNIIQDTDYDEKGNIVSQFKDSFEYDDNGNVILHVSYDENGEMCYKYGYAYDDKGNLIRETDYSENDEIEYEYVYQYNENGDKTFTTVYNKKGEIVSKSESKYDENGNEILFLDYDELGLCEKTEYEYYADGTLKRETVYDDLNIVTSIFEYNAMGDMSHTVDRIMFGIVSDESYYRYKYDENANIVLEVIYDKKGNVVDKTMTEYDDNGNWIHYASYDENDELLDGMKWEYEYDSKGNIVSETMFDGNDIIRISKYDVFGNEIYHASYDENGEIEWFYETKYVNPRIAYDRYPYIP